MNPLFLSLYILVWPVISAVVLAVLVYAVVKDYRDAARSGQDVV
jgi:cytochrome oxidase assembly protein ShyY1